MNKEIKEEILFFIKFGNKKNIQDLYKNGTIYFNTIDYFQRLENPGIRGDVYEGTTNIRNYHEYEKLTLKITIHETGKIIDLHPSKLHLRQYLSDIRGNLLSLYSLKTPDILIENFKINEKVKDFGTHFILIKNYRKFLNKIFSELDKRKYIYNARLVNYYEKDKINGDITLFDKSNEFEYQKEYRILLYNNEAKPISIKIGSLKEYAEIFEVQAIDDMKIDWT